MSNVSRSECHADTGVTQDRGPRTIIRYEEDGDTLVAVCENKNGERWYEVVLKNNEPVF